jgi:hypothetical protein
VADAYDFGERHRGADAADEDARPRPRPTALFLTPSMQVPIIAGSEYFVIHLRVVNLLCTYAGHSFCRRPGFANGTLTSRVCTSWGSWNLFAFRKLNAFKVPKS